MAVILYMSFKVSNHWPSEEYGSDPVRVCKVSKSAVRSTQLTIQNI